MTRKQDDQLLAIPDAQLATIHGGLFGPLDPVIGYFQARETKKGFCQEAAHWRDNARNATDPATKAQYQNYADYKQALCRAY